MSLKEFIEKFVCKNTLIRLWKPAKGWHEMICREDKCVCMEWELVQGKVWQSEYSNYEVVGVKDIVVNDFYREAVNIVINI
jgi:uncharacterized protein YjcR